MHYRVGEENVANNGQKMVIIDYTGSQNIDIQFEDGTIVRHKSYHAFKTGMIANPNKRNLKSTEKVGESNVAFNRQTMTIIAFRGFNDIDVQFEDGTIVTKKHYHAFKKGMIRNPNIVGNSSKYIGETATANNGQNMIIVAYRGANDVDIKFEDGTVVYNKRYHAFKNGNIRNPNLNPQISRVGETLIANNGQKMTIIAYRNVRDLDVQFEDGTIVYNREYQNFKNGEIWNPNCHTNKTNRLGEKVVLKSGEVVTIIAYRNSSSIDIQFENGAIIKNKTYHSLKHNNIQNPAIEQIRKQSHVGESIIANNGQEMTIVAYRCTISIDVQFEDGTIVTNKRYNNFKRGLIANPNKQTCRVQNPNRFAHHIALRTGESKVANNGQKMFIVAYRKFNDIDIQFEDGTILEHKSYKNFKQGSIVNPNFNKS